MSVKGWSWDSKPRSPALEAVASLTTQHHEAWAVKRHARKGRSVHLGPELRVRGQGRRAGQSQRFLVLKSQATLFQGVPRTRLISEMAMQKRKGITGAEAAGEEVRKLKGAFPRVTKMLMEDAHRSPAAANKQPGVHQGRRRCHHGQTIQSGL